MSVRDPIDGRMTEATVVVDGTRLSFAEAMSVRVAIGSMRLTMQDKNWRKNIGHDLADNYDRHLRRVEQLMIEGAKD